METPLGLVSQVADVLDKIGAKVIFGASFDSPYGPESPRIQINHAYRPLPGFDHLPYWLPVTPSRFYSSLSLGMGAAGLRTRRVSAFGAVGTETHRATPSIPNVKTL